MKIVKTTQCALLGLLLEGPHHGYELYQMLTDPAGLGHVWHLGMSLMYIELKALETSGLIKSSLELQDSHPPKKVLILTPEGRSTFRAWLATPAHGIRDMRTTFMVQFFFARRNPRDYAGLIDRQVVSLRSELKKLQSESVPECSNDFGKRVRAFRIGQLKAALDWLRSVRKLAVRR